MKKFKSLVIIQLKDFLGNAQSSLNIKNKKMIQLLQLLIIGSIMAPSIYFSSVTYNAFAQLNQPELVMTTMYLNSVILMFFLGIPIIISVFFFSKDIKFLTTLPVDEDKIILSKLSTVYIYLLAISGIFILPSIIVYGFYSGLSISLVIFGITTFILAPLLPLLISSLLILSINKIIRKSKYKNILLLLGNILLIIAIIGIQMGLTRYAGNPEQIQSALLNNEGLIGLIGIRFPPSIWMTKMLLGSLLDAFYFIGINILFVIFLQYMAKVFFKKALLTFVEGGAKTGSIYYKKRKKGWQLFKRHILIIIKEPTFLLNTLMSLVVPILIFIVMSFSGQFSPELLQSEQIRPFIILIFSLIVIFPAIVSNISSTAITREGKSFWETKVLPISAKLNIKYRIMTTIVINLTGSLVLGIFSYFILPLTFEMILIAIFFTGATTLFLGTVDFIINILRPILNWTHPTAAVKNNMNVTISLGIRVVLGIVIYGLYILFPALFSNYYLVIITASVLFFIIYLISRYYVYNIMIERFKKISI